jgi:hypothetical protein
MYFLHETKAPGCPVFMNGQLHETFSARGADLDMNYPWHAAPSGQPLADLPAELWLITKDKDYSFDYRQAFNGYLVSGELLKELDTNDGWQSAPVQVVSRTKATVTEVEYHFIRAPRMYPEIAGVSDRLFAVNAPGRAGAVFCDDALGESLRRRRWHGLAVLPEEQFARAPKLWSQ